MIKAQLIAFTAGVICGALFARRNSPIVEKAVAIAKKLIEKIKNKIKGK